MRKTLTIIALVSVALLGLSSCSGEYRDPGVLEMAGGGWLGGGDGGDFGNNGGGEWFGGGDNGGGSGMFSSLIGTWAKNTDQVLIAKEDNYEGQMLSFWAPNSTTAMANGDLYFRVISYNGSSAVLRDNYSRISNITINISVNGTTLTISGFTGTYNNNINLTQFNGTYTKYD